MGPTKSLTALDPGFPEQGWGIIFWRPKTITRYFSHRADFKVAFSGMSKRLTSSLARCQLSSDQNTGYLQYAGDYRGYSEPI